MAVLPRDGSPGRTDYPGTAPRFLRQTTPSSLPLGDGSADMVLVCDEMERHPNPLAMLREVGRILAPGTPMAIVSRRRRPTEDAALDPEHRYPWPLLLRQVDMAGGSSC